MPQEILRWAVRNYLPDYNDQELLEFFRELREQIKLYNVNMAECNNEFMSMLGEVAPWLPNDFLRVHSPANRRHSGQNA